MDFSDKPGISQVYLLDGQVVSEKVRRSCSPWWWQSSDGGKTVVGDSVKGAKGTERAWLAVTSRGFGSWWKGLLHPELLLEEAGEERPPRPAIMRVMLFSPRLLSWGRTMKAGGGSRRSTSVSSKGVMVRLRMVIVSGGMATTWQRRGREVLEPMVGGGKNGGYIYQRRNGDQCVPSVGLDGGDNK